MPRVLKMRRELRSDNMTALGAVAPAAKESSASRPLIPANSDRPGPAIWSGRHSAFEYIFCSRRTTGPTSANWQASMLVIG
jgi:hypothetical protein